MKRSEVSAAAVALLLVAGSAPAITVSGLNPNSSSYTVALSNFDSTYSGVDELLIVRSDLGYAVIGGCSGALLADGAGILTAAHCVAERGAVEKATAAYVEFRTPGGTYTSQAVNFEVDPSFDGSTGNPHDVAVLTLATAAPDTMTRYGLSTANTSDQTFTLARYGFGGTGDSGFDAIEYPSGSRRVRENHYDSYAETDDGTTGHDALASPGASEDSALGSAEAFIAPGDLGSPSFIDGRMAAIHSYAARYSPADARTIRNGKTLDSRLGEVASDCIGGIQPSSIQLGIVSAPEPRLMIVLGVALVAIALAGDRRKHG